MAKEQSEYGSLATPGIPLGDTLQLLLHAPLLADAMPQMVWVADKAGKVVYFNRRWYEFNRWEATRPLDDWPSVIHPDDLDRTFYAWQNAIQQGTPYEIEYRFADPAAPGTYRWFLGRALPAFNDSREIIGWFGTATDIDDVKRIENSLRESEHRFRHVADTAPVMIWMSGTDKLCNFFNRAWLSFTGRSMDEELGYGWSAGVHPEDYDAVVDLYNTSFDKREPFYVEYRLRRNDGQYRWISDNGVPRYAPDGTFTGFIGGCLDVHERREYNEELERQVAARTRELQEKNAELRRSNEALEQFAYAASHDLQEPIRKISIFSDLIRANAAIHEHPEVVQNFDKIVQATRRMHSLVGDLLNFSRINREGEYFVATDLNQVLSETRQDLELLIEQKGAVLHNDPLPVITAIPFQIRQLFYNLLSNALKFAREGVPPVLEVQAKQLDPAAQQEAGLPADRSFVALTFADNGIGFPAEAAEQIFILFRRLNAPQQFSGTGIGLALCRKIVQNHGGFITAWGKEGEGAIFTVYLPLEQEENII